MSFCLAAFYFFKFQPSAQTAQAAGDFHYVRAGATGLNNGSDWTNAWTTLPATLVRGDAYYIADGEYGSYIFDDAVSGTQYITIKKAIESDHGTDTGWNANFCGGQAVFESTLIFNNGYYVFDGQSGGGPGSWNLGLGFKIEALLPTSTLINVTNRVSSSGKAPQNIIIEHTEFEHLGREYNSQGSNARAIYQYGYGFDNATISNNYFHDFPASIIQTGNSTNLTLENNFFDTNGAYVNGSSVQAYGFGDYCSNDVVIRNNIFKDIENKIIALYGNHGACAKDNWQIYNNVFYFSANHPEDSLEDQAPVMADSGTVTNNVLVYNNVFSGIHGGGAGVWLYSGDNNRVFNNIFYNNTGNNLYLGNASSEHGNNWFYGNMRYNPESTTSACRVYGACPLIPGHANGYTPDETTAEIGTGDPFIDSANGDFRLSAPTQAGYILSSPYNLDILGNTRGSDGVWDRGAYEYISVPAPDTTPPSAPSGVSAN